MRYKIVFDKRAQKEINRLNPKEKKRIGKKIDNLATNPRPGGKNFRYLKYDDLYRIRTGRLRIVYSIDGKDRKIVIERVRKRDEKTYQFL